MKLSQTAVTPCGPEVLCDRFRPKIGPVTLAHRFQFHLLDHPAVRESFLLSHSVRARSSFLQASLKSLSLLGN